MRRRMTKHWPSSFIGRPKVTDIVRPYSKDVWETRDNRNPLVPRLPYGLGCMMLQFTDNFDSLLSAYTDDQNEWDEGLLDMGVFHFPADQIGAFSITDIGLPSGVSTPQYIASEEGIPREPTLKQFQSYYYQCRSAKQIQARIIDIIIFVDTSGPSPPDPGYQDLKDAVDSTEFPAWLETTGAKVYKHFGNGNGLWLGAYEFYLNEAHNNTLIDLASNW